MKVESGGRVTGRRTRWAMVVVGLAAVVSIAFLATPSWTATWGVVASALLVAWASFGLLTEGRKDERVKWRAMKRIAVGFLKIVVGFLVVVLGLVAVYVYRASTFQLRINAGGWGEYTKWVVYWRHAPWWAWAAWAIVALGILMLPALRRYTATVPAPTGRMSSPPWAFVLSVSVLVLAAILLVADLNRETFCCTSALVLVAKRLIPKGTPGLIVATKGMYAPTTMPVEEVEDGAISDPSYMCHRRRALVDILPGQQITVSDFSHPTYVTGGGDMPTPVLVARQLIPRGTSAWLIASQSMYVPTTLPRKEVEVGAVADLSYLAGRPATVDICPGQQITMSDFTGR